ncbi:MAG: hypothetical protein RLZZ157_103 [Pseudomonadota bacterium]|jgi:hypothetical protein
MDAAVYTRSQLMTLLGYKCPKSFRARLPALHALGFPLPLPTRGICRWSKPQVDHWIATGGRTQIVQDKAPKAAPTNITQIDAARARLAIQATRF